MQVIFNLPEDTCRELDRRMCRLEEIRSTMTMDELVDIALTAWFIRTEVPS